MKKNSLFMACLMFINFVLIIVVMGMLQFYIGHPEIPQRKEYVKLREIR